jgi:serine/threonine-protein kinase
MLVVLDGTRRVQTLLQTPSAELNGFVSPDGKWLAYESDRSGQSEIYVAPYPGASMRQWKISSGGGTRPLWAPSSHELFYVSSDGAVMAVRVDPRGQPLGDATKAVEALYATGGPGFLPPRNYDVSPDGKRFLMLKPAVDQSPAPQIIIVQNWSEELKRLVPTN